LGIPTTATMPIHTTKRKPYKAFASHWPPVIPAHGLKRFISNLSHPLEGQCQSPSRLEETLIVRIQ
jgi:hypothetical protein